MICEAHCCAAGGYTASPWLISDVIWICRRGPSILQPTPSSMDGMVLMSTVPLPLRLHSRVPLAESGVAWPSRSDSPRPRALCCVPVRAVLAATLAARATRRRRAHRRERQLGHKCPSGLSTHGHGGRGVRDALFHARCHRGPVAEAPGGRDRTRLMGSARIIVHLQAVARRSSDVLLRSRRGRCVPVSDHRAGHESSEAANEARACAPRVTA